MIRNRIGRLLGASFGLVAVTVLPSVASEIPEPVITECNAIASASDLPDCLREGAIAFKLLEAAREDAFYGPSAGRVVDACAETNEGFEKTWICFRNAAKSAAETHELIGLEQIADRCVADISNPAAYDRLIEKNRDLRRTYFPEEMFSGGNTYRAFQGCPDDAVEEVDPGAGKASDGFGPDACAAFAEVEAIIASHPAEELRTLAERLKASDGDEAEARSLLSLSPEAEDYLFAGEEKKRGLQLVALVGAFVEEHHPVLFDEFLEARAAETEGSGQDFASAAGRGLVMVIVDAAADRYAQDCGATRS